MINKSIRIPLIIYACLHIIDLISTLIYGKELIQYLELNPLFKYFGFAGIGILVGVMIFYIDNAYFKAKKPSNRYLWVSGVVIICIQKIYVITSNLRGFFNRPTITEAQQISVQIAQESVAGVHWQSFMPIILNSVITLVIIFVVYAFFQIDHKIEKKEEI